MKDWKVALNLILFCAGFATIFHSLESDSGLFIGAALMGLSVFLHNYWCSKDKLKKEKDVK